MKNKKDTLGNRMKEYENISRIYLTKKSPVIIRIDGKAFHTLTKGFVLPFDKIFMRAMQETAKYLCKNISGCKLAYVQSDEISLLLTDYDTRDTQPWFGNNLQKLVSVAASMATLAFNNQFLSLTLGIEDLYTFHNATMCEKWGDRTEKNFDAYGKATHNAMFDARAFILPKEEVCNYFIWRQQDATRNSILAVAQSYFSHSILQGKKCNELQEMLFTQKQVNWNDYTTPEKRGTCIIRQKIKIDGVIRNQWIVDENIPVFTKDKNYIEKNVFI